MKNLNKQNGITLIALVITIIVLLILAGVTIAMITGENGILKYSKVAEEKYNEESAREKLEIKLAEMHIEKLTNSEYNQDEYLTQQLINEGFEVSGDIVIVDGWQFQIDRSVPKIAASLGKGIKNEEIQIELSQKVATDYTKSTITIKIISSEEIKSILLNGEEVIGLIQEDGTITKEVTSNGIYTVIAKDINDNYNINSITVTEITEDMDIWNKEDLIAFRKKVNQGRTFEGRTVRVMADIELNEGKYTIGTDGSITFASDAEQWITIGNTTNAFKGKFEGGNHTVNGIYINDSTKNMQGLFGVNRGTIKNIIVAEGSITAGHSIGGIAGSNYGTIENTINKINIQAKGIDTNKNSNVGGITGPSWGGILKNNTNYGDVVAVGGLVGGICPYVSKGLEEIYNCKNLSKKVLTTGSNTSGNSLTAGIIGYILNTNINQCFNGADVTASGAGVGGIAGNSDSNNIKNSYNIGNIKSTVTNTSSNNNVGGIAGVSMGLVSDSYNRRKYRRK